MGKYINVNGSKVDWLTNYGTTIMSTEADGILATGAAVPVCLIDNGAFTAALVCDTVSEIRAGQREDGRMKLWYAVKREALEGIGIKL